MIDLRHGDCLDVRECPVCGKTFKKRVYRKCQAVYCSRQCAYEGRALGFTRRRVIKPYNCKRKVPRNCLMCGKPFIYGNKRQKYCSRKCFESSHKIRMRGSGNPSWIDGSSYNKRCFRGVDWDEKRLATYRRDNWTCQICGVKCGKKRIQCHHIIPYSTTKDNRMGNLITLCASCHATLHNRGG